jgi:hypothetical protein
MTVQGKNINLYVSHGVTGGLGLLMPIKCQGGAELSIQFSHLETKHKTSGVGRTRIYKDYDWSMSGNFVYFLYPSVDEETGIDSIMAFGLAQKKLFVIFDSVEGSNTVRYFGRVVVGNVSITGQNGDMAQASVSLLGDGELAMTQGEITLHNLENFGNVYTYKRVSTTTETTFTITDLIDVKVLGVALKKTGLSSTDLLNRIIPVDIIANTGVSVTSGHIGYVIATGEFKINPTLVSGDQLIFYYDLL